MKLFVVDHLVNFLSLLGIREHKPEDTKYLKYSSLKGREIRIINRLIACCEVNKIEDVRKLFKKAMFTQKVVSTKNSEKERVIELCKTKKFFEILKKLNISKFLEEEKNLIKLLCLSPDKTDLIMISKLVTVIKQFKISRYFRRFGVKARNPFPHKLNTIYTDQTYESVKTNSSNSCSNFSEVDLSNDEKVNRRFRLRIKGKK
jgi:hypothetical protein